MKIRKQKRAREAKDKRNEYLKKWEEKKRRKENKRD